MDINLAIAGEAGQGLKTMEEIIAKALHRHGYHVFSHKDYMSRVRGGHNFMQIRFGNVPHQSPREEIDILVALNQDGIDNHQQRVQSSGYIIFDGQSSEDKMISVAAKKLAQRINPRATNTVFLGVLWQLLGLELTELKQVIKERFKKEEVQQDNLELLEAGYEATSNSFSIEEPAKKGEEDYLLLEGNQAVGLGAAVAGVQFYSAYPMTPSTGVLNYLAARQDKLGIAVEQAEDEIAAINMALGASFAGARTMTGTSGGGFALMTEAFGLAGVMEAPIVIAEVMRPGPATGMPTRTGQGDLSFVLNASQDEFPLKVIAPRDQEDAFYQTFRAFNLADKYQMPVVILSDQFLADSAATVPKFALDELEINRYLVDEESWPEDKEYKRYEITEDGISPRAYPGQLPGEVVLADSHEHFESGRISEEIETRNAMVDKRARKFEKQRREDTLEPLYQGPEKPEVLMLGFGSTYGVLKEVQQKLSAEGKSVGMLSFNDVWPLPTAELEKRYSYNTHLVVVENNNTGQFSRLVTAYTEIGTDYRLLKYDGRPFTTDELYRRMKEEVKY